MVTMSSEKAVRRKQDTNNGGQQAATTPHTPNSDDTPNHLVYKKVSKIIRDGFNRSIRDTVLHMQHTKLHSKFN